MTIEHTPIRHTPIRRRRRRSTKRVPAKLEAFMAMGNRSGPSLKRARSLVIASMSEDLSSALYEFCSRYGISSNADGAQALLRFALGLSRIQ